MGVLLWMTPMLLSRTSESRLKLPSRSSLQFWAVAERGRRRSTPHQKRSSTSEPRSSSTLKLYKVDDVGKLERKRKECPQETCGAGIFFSNHRDRQYCGRCGLTIKFNENQ